MENTETAPLLGPAGHSMYHRSASDNVQLLPIVEPSSAMASPAIDDLSTSQSQDRFSEDSLRRRASSRSSGAGDDFFNIEDNDPVAHALQQCETWVLRPYRVVLRTLGWTQFTRDGDNRLYFILRMILVSIWTVVLITTFITQILCCFKRDTFTPGKVHMSDRNLTSNSTITSSQSDIRRITCSQHVISSFIFFDLLLLFTYWFGLYLFSKGETEYLSNLAEKVFVKEVTFKKNMASNYRVIVTVLAFMVVGAVWIALSFAVRIMTARTVRLFESNTVIYWNEDTTFRDGGKLVLIIFSLFGFFTFDMVYVTAVMNYAAQSEMLIYLLRSVRGLIEEKGYEGIDAAIKDIMEVRNYLRVLNGKTATATALILYNLGSAGVLALITLDEISTINAAYFNHTLATVAAGLNVVLWIGLVCFPFVQAARVTYECNKLKESGPYIRTRPFQYSNTPQLDLDSFVTFTQAVKLRATMFGIPIHPWMVYMIVVVFTFTMLILFQTGIYSFSKYL